MISRWVSCILRRGCLKPLGHVHKLSGLDNRWGCVSLQHEKLRQNRSGKKSAAMDSTA